ncbi:zinc ABC transporter substrate-binding protein [Xylanimonas allomyrinae]|uniref:Zinc ABC transporter substrate-binding protein n=1 Tax=Xylanimonas allomyrinae TaxID=2509459 RepID=A0A4P6EK91_9MICO|nr:zinc ABC transporter substrate-binding protein [Xylanimonas allomyrinae]QAY63032.1 zinc ABC transporter substrate-binding protein [Xylanimonas allomyrinae]
MHLRRTAALAATAVLVPLALTGCATTPSADDADGRVQVLASFYPLQFVAEQVGGDLVDVQNLTPPAADPHDLELSPARSREIGQADVVVFLSGFQPAVDDAIAQRQPENVVDAADHVTLLSASVTGGDQAHSHDHEADEADHAHDDAEADHDHEADTGATDDHADHDHATDDHDHATDDHDHATDEAATDEAATDDHATDGDATDDHAADDHADHDDMSGNDPHFWLDPTLLAQLADPVADALTKADPGSAETFAANAAALRDRLADLDQELAEGLAPFKGATLITNHTAFGYLAQRYGLEQVGITGLDHNTEPSPARLREIGQIARDHNVSTLFYETLVSPRVVQTLASDQGLKSAVLDTLEGLNQQSLDAGDDFISIMQRNLQILQEGLVAP